MLMDLRVPGPVRERLLVAQYRHKGEGAAVTVVELSRLCRDSGFRGAADAAIGDDYFNRKSARMP